MGNNIKEIYLKGQEKLKRMDFFTTGFDDLDIFCKYLEGGNILTIGGRPAMGKTNFAVSLANHLLEKRKSVLFVSLELSGEQIVNRLIAEKTGIPLHKVLKGKVREEEVNTFLDSFEDKNVFINDKLLTTDEIEESIKEIKPEIVFIDYVQLVEAPKAPNRTEAVNIIIKDLKRIAVENNVIIVLLSQMSRAVESRFDKHPVLSDLRNGSLLEEISDVVLFLYRESYYDCEAENPKNEIIIAKNTTGPVGIVSTDFEYGFFRNKKVSDTF